jgi:acetoin utilization deacetylase AcuC-like enzyme
MDVEGMLDQLRTGDTMICEASLRVAALAAGSCLNAVDAVIRGDHTRAFCAVRPPGHHASSDRGMGFCIYNNIAIAARYARQKYGLERVLIVDWDVHHGNGTQDIFYRDPSVFFFSTHQWPLYPGTGELSEKGAGEAVGTNINVHLAEGTGGQSALDAVEKHLLPAMDRFKPQLILISAGFDARIHDPLGGLHWTDRDFATWTRTIMHLADQHAEGRIVSILEGGYNPAGLASAVETHVRALAEPLPRTVGGAATA